MLRITSGLLLAGILVLNPQARAADASSTSTSGLWGTVMKYGKASYLLEVLGPTTKALSGNKLDGNGTNLKLNHYLAAGASLGNGYSTKLTGLFVQSVNDKPESDGKTFVIADPYLTVSKSKILHSERHAASLDGYIRYYIPASLGNRNNVNVGGIDDRGRGRVRLLLTPSKSWFDGKLTLTGTMFSNIRFNSNTPQERFDKALAERVRNGGVGGNGPNKTLVAYRKDWDFVVDPILAYTINNKWEIYGEYSTVWTHSTDGKWTSVNDVDDGHNVYAGFNWGPTKKVAVNAYVGYGLNTPAPDLDIDRGSLGFSVQYSFL